MVTVGPSAVLQGRSREREELDRALRTVRAGQSAVLVLRGEAGIGKTSLLDYLIEQASGCRLAQVAGVESELELPFSALHQLCAPMLDLTSALPEPQQRALAVAFGRTEGPVPDRFVVGLAVLGLLAEAAAAAPLVCVVDDAHWLDETSAQVLGFVGRRLKADAVLMAFAVRDPHERSSLAGMPELAIGGLDDTDAAALLAAALPGRLDGMVRDRVVAETRGNPLALLELAKGGQAGLMGGFALPTSAAGGLQGLYVRRIRAMSPPARQLLVVAAADPTGDATLLWRAAKHLGLGPDAAQEVEQEQLVEIGARVRFRHPLVRAAAYAAGSVNDRRTVHLALAEATDGVADAERRIWHRSAAATGPDEELAAALEASAIQVEARGGAAASAALLHRSVALTADPDRRAERALAAAHAHLDAGSFDTALALLAEADADAANELQGARVELLRGLIDRAARSSGNAPAALLRAAQRLEPIDARLARHTYLDAWGAALVAGGLAGDGADLASVSAFALAAPLDPNGPVPGDHLIAGLSGLVAEGTAAAAPELRLAVGAFMEDDIPIDDFLHCGVLVANAALALWDYDAWAAVSDRHVDLARAAGALAPLANALNAHRVVALWRGDVDRARRLGLEEQTVKDVTGIERASYGDIFLLAHQGRVAEAEPVFSAAAAEARSRGEGLGLHITDRATALLNLGVGRYAEAAAAASRAADGNLGPFIGQSLPDLVEAAVRSGATEVAQEAMARLTSYTAVPDSDWAAGMEARSRALLAEGEAAERAYAEAVERLERTEVRFELARAHLLFGEWLRRERRRGEAREQLRSAFDEFVAMRADGFAERARHELLATGEKVRKRTVDTLDQLTPQEVQIARMARDGQTNQEIGAELYISARTVEWHLSKVFGKLGISSRRQLPGALI